MHASVAVAVADVRATFGQERVSLKEDADGSVIVTVQDVPLGSEWIPATIHLRVRLLPTFPSTPPYPFYGPAGLRRSDGRTFGALQPNVTFDGQPHAQISLTKPFDAQVETLSSRFVAVIQWLRNPRWAGM